MTAPVGDQVTFECAVNVPGERLAWRWKPIARPDESWKDAEGSSDREKLTTRLVFTIKDDTESALYQVCTCPGVIISLNGQPWFTDHRRNSYQTNISLKSKYQVDGHNYRLYCFFAMQMIYIWLMIQLLLGNSLVSHVCVLCLFMSMSMCTRSPEIPGNVMSNIPGNIYFNPGNCRSKARQPGVSGLNPPDAIIQFIDNNRWLFWA